MTAMLKKIAIYENRSDKSFIERYRLKRFDGEVATVDLTPSVAKDGKSLRAMLQDAGFALASDPDKLAQAIASASKATGPDRNRRSRLSITRQELL
jgi:hypothetical protein